MKFLALICAGLFPLACLAQRSPLPALPPVTNAAQAAADGRALVDELLSHQPEATSASGTLKIRDRSGRLARMHIRFQTFVTKTNWISTYEAGSTNAALETKLSVLHDAANPNVYELVGPESGGVRRLSGNETMIPFAGSDFWLADLGLEFFHWPDQRVIKKEMARTQFCNVLESIHPSPAPGGYSRVLSWIDHDSGAIIKAEAYDHRNRLLKEFRPRALKKVKGQWQLREMEIDNVQTGSRTRIEFDFQ